MEELVTFKLIVYRDGDYAELGLPGINNMIWPPTESIITFIVPDSLTDALFGRISMVSDSCRIRVLRYSEPTYFVESAGYFSIVP